MDSQSKTLRSLIFEGKNREILENDGIKLIFSAVAMFVVVSIRFGVVAPLAIDLIHELIEVIELVRDRHLSVILVPDWLKFLTGPV